jgi:COMPASS component BRE2
MFAWGGVDGDVIGNSNTTALDSTAPGVVGGSEVLQGGVGAALDSVLAPTPGLAGASDSAANSNQATPAPIVDVPNSVDESNGAGTAETPSVAVEIPAVNPNEDVEMT